MRRIVNGELSGEIFSGAGEMSAGAKENWIRRRKKALTTGVGEERGEGEVRPV